MSNQIKRRGYTFDEALIIMKDGETMKHKPTNKYYKVMPHMQSGRAALYFSDDGKSYSYADSIPEFLIMSNEWG